jgi:hypothetical protein
VFSIASGGHGRLKKLVKSMVVVEILPFQWIMDVSWPKESSLDSEQFLD